MSAQKRPLSPHLQIYSKQITSVMSILHRITGIILAIGSLGLLWILVALSLGEAAFSTTQACLSSSFGRFVLLAFSACLMYHFFNGIRHLLWDAGKGFAIPDVYRSGYAVIALTVLCTAGIWWLALQGGAA
ncbi:succinate dehydrogenase, cytochrome b556 subunit [Arenimonas sp. GDDSR-1]|uniref:succinate dehydrogenase, cytochrome b556 subunit n=1 Tax=Arenimonas sp. GDDSR-1 TaxID=2950125 RepID=UPI00261CD63B|nr:succinate dehydrogenase, cytochrome b556 subunit [Arenimonas sp. GDDSR-1]